MTQLLVPKSPLCLKKVGGMRLWIGTSTFKEVLLFNSPPQPLNRFDCYCACINYMLQSYWLCIKCTIFEFEEQHGTVFNIFDCGAKGQWFNSWLSPKICFHPCMLKLGKTTMTSKYVGENGVSGPWGKWSEIKLFVQIQAHCPLLLTFFMIEI